MAHNRYQNACNLPIFKQVDGHKNLVPFYITQNMFNGIPFELAGGGIENLIDQPVALSHVHKVDEIYFLISPNPGEAKIEVTIENETSTYTSPSIIYIPAGKRHFFITKKSSIGSYCFGILFESKGNTP